MSGRVRMPALSAPQLTAEAVVALLQRDVKAAGGQVAFARVTGVSQTHLSGVLRGVCYPGAKIAKIYGLEVWRRPPVFVRAAGRARARVRGVARG